MAKQEINVQISGISPILLHRHPTEKIEALDKKEPEEQAEVAAYRDVDGNLYVPANNLRSCMVGAAIYSKGKGRASLQKPAAAVIQISPDPLNIQDENGHPISEYIIDSQWGRNPTTKGAVLIHRPKIIEWRLMFDLEYDDRFFSDTQIREVMDNAGFLVGLCDFRPANKGPFGRFQVDHWEKVKLDT